jgi:general secretion pathway protein M
MPRNSPRDLPTGTLGRILALALPAIALLFLIFGVVMPLADYWRSLDAEHARLAEQAAGDERLLSRKGKLASEVSALKGQLDEGVDFLPQAEPAVAAAQVQSNLGELAERSGAVIRSTLTLPIAVADGFTAIGFQLNVTGSVVAARDLLYAIESGHPRLVIDRLNIVPSQQSDPAARTGEVDMSLDLHGYMVGEVEQ